MKTHWSYSDLRSHLLKCTKTESEIASFTLVVVQATLLEHKEGNVASTHASTAFEFGCESSKTMTVNQIHRRGGASLQAGTLIIAHTTLNYLKKKEQ